MNRKAVEKYEIKLKRIINNSIHHQNFETALQATAACASINYAYNQKYTDEFLENALISVGGSLVSFSDWNEKDNIHNKKVLFYDGFGADRRGIAIVTCKAICANGYSLIYVSPIEKKECQPTLHDALCGLDVKWEYIDTSHDYSHTIFQLNEIFERSKPRFSFLYTLPNDVSGITIFDYLAGKTCRCQLDLTDHAFWLGVNAFDYCCGGRQYSASIQFHYRGIPQKDMLQLDANLFVDDCELGDLPFDHNSRFIFSGGDLYKTLGDEKNTYYEIIKEILISHSDIKFLYAGKGDTSEILKLVKEFPQRVFYVEERKDFYQIIKKCTLYLNTYPMFGGLMMRYAAMAGKIPITLKHGNDSDGILISQDTRQIEYDSFDALIADVDRLLSDDSYLREREEKLIGAVVTEDCYVRNIKMIIEEHKTEFPYDVIQKIDTTKFRSECFDRFTEEDVLHSISIKRHRKLIIYFPVLFANASLRKIKARIGGTK